MPVIELLQFPQAGRKTGELVVTSSGQEARIYYAKGKLVHAAMGTAKGAAVLVPVVDWTDGSFEFNSDVAAPATTIDVDVQRAVMEAVRLRDEAKEAARKAPPPAAPPANDKAQTTIKGFVSATPWAVRVSLTDGGGVVLADAAGEGTADLAVEPLLTAVRAWPRPGFRRVLIEDDAGILVAIRLAAGTHLFVAAAKGSTLGVVTAGAAKLAASLEA